MVADIKCFCHFNATLLSKAHEDVTGVYRSPSTWIMNKNAKRVIAALGVKTGLPFEKLCYREQGCDRSKWGVYLHNELKPDFMAWLEYSGIESREQDIRLKLLALNSDAQEVPQGILTTDEFIKISHARKCVTAVGEALIYAGVHNVKPRLHLYGIGGRGVIRVLELQCLKLGVKITWEERKTS